MPYHPSHEIITKPQDYTFRLNQNWAIFSNEGAAGPVTYTLPLGAEQGATEFWINGAEPDLTVVAPHEQPFYGKIGDLILDGDMSFTLDGDNVAVHLIFMGNHKWLVADSTQPAAGLSHLSHVHYLSAHPSFAAALATIGTDPAVLIVDIDGTVAVDTTTPTTLMLDFSGSGVLTVANGKTLTIGSMNDPGNKKVFTLGNASSHVRIAPAAVERMNVAWIAGIAANADITRAIDEYLGSISAGGKSGEIFIPSGTWHDAGNHQLVSNVTFRGVNRQGLVTLTTSGTYVFRATDNVTNVEFIDVAFDGASLANAVGVLFQPTTLGIAWVKFDTCTFLNFKRAISGDPVPGFVQLIGGISIEKTVFGGNTEAAIYWKANNGEVKVKDNTFFLPAGAWALKLGNFGVWQVHGNEWGGAGTGGGAIYFFGGEFAVMNLNGNEDENNEFFILDEAMTTFGQVSITGYVSGKIVLNGSSTYTSRGGLYYLDQPFTDKNTPNAVPNSHVFSYGDFSYGKDVNNLGNPPAAVPKMSNFTHGVNIMVTEQRNTGKIINRYTQRFVEESPATAYLAVDDPMLFVGSTRQERDLLVIGDYVNEAIPIFSAYASSILGAGGTGQYARLRWEFSSLSSPTKGGWVFDNFPIITTPHRPAQIVADLNDYNPGRGCNILYLSTSANHTITGFTFDLPPTDGQGFRLINNGTFNILLTNQDAASASPNRMITTTGGTLTLTPNQEAFAHYDGTAQRWRVSKMN